MEKISVLHLRSICEIVVLFVNGKNIIMVCSLALAVYLWDSRFICKWKKINWKSSSIVVWETFSCWRQFHFKRDKPLYDYEGVFSLHLYNRDSASNHLFRTSATEHHQIWQCNDHRIPIYNLVTGQCYYKPSRWAYQKISFLLLTGMTLYFKANCIACSKFLGLLNALYHRFYHPLLYKTRLFK